MDITVRPLSVVNDHHREELDKVSEAHLQFIQHVKEEIGEEVDTTHPVPLFTQLR